MRSLYQKRGSLRRLLSIGRRRQLEEDVPCDSHGSPAAGELLQDSHSPQRPTWRCFPYEEIHEATAGFHQRIVHLAAAMAPFAAFSCWRTYLMPLFNRFNVGLAENLVGKGGYAEVYRGVLQDGQVIAVKRLSGASTDEQREKDFLTELGTVGHVRHPNISALLGCCIDRSLHLVFEFSSLGSVSSLLHDEPSQPVAWKLRYKIAVGIARGLHYLHSGCRRRIIHRDIKASNILLTADFEPRISDFGLAKWLPSEWTNRTVAPIEGTFGYLAPEYFMHGIVDEKTDVFAFGVLLLEIVSGRKPVDGSHQSLLSWAKPHFSNGATRKLVDPRLGDDCDNDQLNRLAFAASLCIRATARWRPSMSEVLDLLVGGEVSHDRWKMPVEEEEGEDFWGFDDLEEECYSPLSSSSSSTASS